MTAKKTAPKKKTPSKKSSPKKATEAKTEEPTQKIISTAKCLTVSGKSTLTYHVGTDDNQQIFIRIQSNTGGGFFSNEWVALDDITAILGEAPGDHPITSINLIPLFKGKSVNTPGYLLAVLLNEKLLTPFEDKKRQFVYTGKNTLQTKATKRKKAQ